MLEYYFPFGARPIFRGELLVSGSVIEGCVFGVWFRFRFFTEWIDWLLSEHTISGYSFR